MKTLIISITLLIHAVLFSQENDFKENSMTLKEKNIKIYNFKKVDYISRHYKYLDSNFNLKISKNKFSKLIFDKEQRIETYKDSLMVILYAELGDYDAVNIAFHRILFSWKKLSLYIWENESYTKQLSIKLGFKHPYKFYEFIRNPNNNSLDKVEILKKLQIKISEKKIDTISLKPYDKFLNYTFKNNPARLKENEEYYHKQKKNRMVLLEQNDF